MAAPPDVAGVGGPRRDWAEVVLSALGWKCVPTAVFSNCWTTGLIESRCSAGLDVADAGACLMSN